MSILKRQLYAKNQINIILLNLNIQKEIIKPPLYDGCYTEISDSTTLFCRMDDNGEFEYTLRIKGKTKFFTFDTNDIYKMFEEIQYIKESGVFINE